MISSNLIFKVLLLTLLYGLSIVSSNDVVGESRNLKVLFSDTVTLTCVDDDLVIHNNPNATYQWLLPSGQLIDTNNPPNHHSDLHLDDNSSTLTISGVGRRHFGVYMCLIHIEDKVQEIVQWAVNIDGPYYGDLSAKYWAQCKIGLLAGLAVMLFTSMMCLNMEQYDNYHTPRNLDSCDDFIPKPTPGGLRQYYPSVGTTTLNHGDGTGNNLEMFYKNPAFVDDVGMMTIGQDHAHAFEENGLRQEIANGQGETKTGAIVDESKTVF